MSIFPTININTSITSITDSTLPMAKEYGWDFENNCFLLEDGKHVIVTGIEAVKVWIWKALVTPRYVYGAYTWNWGNELDKLFGLGYSKESIKSESERYVKESLLVIKYITELKDIVIEVYESQMDISFTALTIYGEVTFSVPR